jgi:hypothetical protein
MRRTRAVSCCTLSLTQDSYLGPANRSGRLPRSCALQLKHSTRQQIDALRDLDAAHVRVGSIASRSLRPLLGRSCRRVTSAASGVGAHQLASWHSPGRYIGVCPTVPLPHLLRLEIPARTLARPSVRVNARRLQVGMPERRRHEGDRRTIVDGVTGCACRSQCTDAARFTPARAAVSLTM